MVAADWTIALGSSGKALMRCCVRYGDADIAALNSVSLVSNMFNACAHLAVIKIFTQTFSSSTYTAVWAVVDFLLTIVVPQLADIAIVTRGLSFTVVARITRLLRGATHHA